MPERDYAELARVTGKFLAARQTSEEIIGGAVEHLRRLGLLRPWSAAGEVAFLGRREPG